MVIHANSLFWRMTESESAAAIDMLNRAIKRYPNYAPAHSMLAFMLLVSSHLHRDAFDGTRADASAGTRRACRGTRRQRPVGASRAGLRGVHAATHRPRARPNFNALYSLNPNFAAAHGYLGWTLAFDGQSDKAMTHLEEALRMSPHDPQNAIFNVGMAIAHYMAGRYEKPSLHAGWRFNSGPEWRAEHASTSPVWRRRDGLEEARAALARMKETHPDLSIAWIEQNVPYTPAAMAKFLEGMRKAGLN